MLRQLVYRFIPGQAAEWLRQFARLKVVLCNEALYRILVRADDLPRLDQVRYSSNSPIDTHLMDQTLTVILWKHGRELWPDQVRFACLQAPPDHSIVYYVISGWSFAAIFQK